MGPPCIMPHDAITTVIPSARLQKTLLDHVYQGAGGQQVQKLLDCRKGPYDYELKVQ